jgi:hypothetical protein
MRRKTVQRCKMILAPLADLWLPRLHRHTVTLTVQATMAQNTSRPVITRETLAELQQLRNAADARGDYALGWALDLAITLGIGGGESLINDAIARLKRHMGAVEAARAQP